MGRDPTVESGLSALLLDRIYGTNYKGSNNKLLIHSGIFLPRHILCRIGRHQDHVFAFFWMSEFSPLL